MQIKQQMLAHQVQKRIAPLYILVGQDNYLLEQSLSTIRTAIKKNYDCEEKIISIQGVDDWTNVREEANSYSLFSETILLTIFFDKKSIDAAGKKILTEYLGSINSRCFIIIKAPNVPAKQLQWLSSNEHAIVSIAYPLNSVAMKNWIITELRNNAINFEQQVPEIIHQYTQGNMLACAQVIEKIVLCSTEDRKVNIQQVQEHLSDQSEHDLFELVEACLLGHSDKVIQVVRHAANNKTEATLVLWMLTQEVRTILQLSNLLQQRIDLKTACAQLKIWPQRVSLYQSCCSRTHQTVFQQLHRYCYAIDERIKSNLNTQVWNSLENLALSLCSGKLIGDTCNI